MSRTFLITVNGEPLVLTSSCAYRLRAMRALRAAGFDAKAWLQLREEVKA